MVRIAAGLCLVLGATLVLTAAVVVGLALTDPEQIRPARVMIPADALARTAIALAGAAAAIGLGHVAVAIGLVRAARWAWNAGVAGSAIFSAALLVTAISLLVRPAGVAALAAVVAILAAYAAICAALVAGWRRFGD